MRIRPRPVRPDSLSKKQSPEVLGEGAGGLAVLHAEMSQPLGGAVVMVWAFLSFLLALVYVANPKAYIKASSLSREDMAMQFIFVFRNCL